MPGAAAVVGTGVGATATELAGTTGTDAEAVTSADLPAGVTVGLSSSAGGASGGGGMPGARVYFGAAAEEPVKPEDAEDDPEEAWDSVAGTVARPTAARPPGAAPSAASASTGFVGAPAVPDVACVSVIN